MNRAERRRSARQQEKPKTYVLTDVQIDQMRRDITAEASRKAFLMFMSIPVMVLHDKFGFDETQSGRFMDYAMVWFESVYDNETELMELMKIAEKECGIRTIAWEENNDNHTSRSFNQVSKK